MVENNSGSVLSQIERAGFSEGHVDFSTVGGITSRSALRDADVFWVSASASLCQAVPANAAPSVPEFLVENNSGSVLSQIERAGFSEGHVDFSTVGGIASRSALRDADVFGLQFRPRFARRPGESGADDGPRFSQDLASRLSSVSIESMARQLLAGDHVLAARKLVDRVPSDHVTESLRRLRVVLAEPVVRRMLPASAKHSGDIDWLRKNAYSYSGKWVALADGTLLAADESLSALRRRLRELDLKDQSVPTSPVATTMLRFRDGSAFTTGMSSYIDADPSHPSETSRIHVRVEFDGASVLALLDTGAAWSMLNAGARSGVGLVRARR